MSQKMEKLKILLMVLGLGLYLLDVSLHLSIASKYLTMQGCFRSVSHQFHNFKLEDLIQFDLENQSFDLRADSTEELENEVKNDLSGQLSDFLDDNLYLKLRNQFIRILPQHWIDRIVNMITFQAGRYRGSDISKLCRLNGNQFASLAEMAIYVCDQALDDVKQQKTRAAKALNSFFQDDSTEDALVEALVTNDLKKIMDVLVTDILANGDLKNAKKLQDIFHRLSNTFSDPEDVASIMKFLGEPAVKNNMGQLMSTLSGIEPETLKNAAKTFGKIQPENMPKIDSLLKELNVTLASFISDPGILFSFFGDPEKAKIMMEVQQLLPLFTPEDLESVLNIKIKFDEIPQSDEIFGQILALPGHILHKIFQLNLDTEELDTLKLAAEKLISNENTLNLIGLATDDLDLLSSTGRSKFVSQCRHKSLHIECIDDTVDLCSNGHYYYGICILAICAIPGILFAVSDYINYRGFTFGKLLGNPMLRNWPGIIKLVLLPIYAAFMVPFIVLVTVFSYLKAIRSLVKTNTVNINGNQLDDIKRLRREKEFHATKFHSLESHGQSFFQIILQTYFLFLLLLLGTGTVIAGVNAETFFKNIFPLTVSSILISLINFIRTSWSLQAKDHLAKEELEGSLVIKTELKSFKQKSQILTHILWTLGTVIFYGGSIVLLSLLGYVEMFSSELMESGSTVNIHILPFLVLCSSVPINLILYKMFINNKDSFSFAHAILSSVLPLRYLHYDNSSRTKKYLLGNQITTWLSHLIAWLTYSVAIYVNYNNEETGLSRLFPVLATLCTIPPLFGAIHWAIAIQPTYEENKQNPDDLSVLSLKGQTCKLQISWQFCTSLTRITSVALLAYVHYEHWAEVGWSNVKLAVAETVPFLVLLVLGNIALQFVHQFGTVAEGLIGMLMPNGYLKAQLQIREDKSAVGLASRYIVANVVWNAILHILLWLVLAFYCWECTKVLSLTKLIYCFPIAMAVFLLNFLFTIYVWKKSIRPILDTPLEYAMDQNEVPENWTSAKVYSTQL